MKSEKVTVASVASVAISVFILDVFAVVEENIGHGSTMDMIRRCFCSVLFKKDYADVTSHDFQRLDEDLIQLVKLLSTNEKE